MVKLTAELIEQAAQYTNAVRDRELDLRGAKDLPGRAVPGFGGGGLRPSPGAGLCGGGLRREGACAGGGARPAQGMGRAGLGGSFCGCCGSFRSDASPRRRSTSCFVSLTCGR